MKTALFLKLAYCSGSNRRNRYCFGETGTIKHYQTLIPKQLANEVLRSLNGELANTQEFLNNNCLQGKILFSKNGAINQGVGQVM